MIEVEYVVQQGIYDTHKALDQETRQLNAFSKGAEKFNNKNIAEHFHYEHGDLQEQKLKSKTIVSKKYFSLFSREQLLATVILRVPGLALLLPESM